MAEPVKILIVEDHALVRKGLLALLAVKPDIKVEGVNRLWFSISQSGRRT